jgi:hypothetical protein
MMAIHTKFVKNSKNAPKLQRKENICLHGTGTVPYIVSDTLKLKENAWGEGGTKSGLSTVQKSITKTSEECTIFEQCSGSVTFSTDLSNGSGYGIRTKIFRMQKKKFFSSYF